MIKHYALINKLTAKPGKREEVVNNLLESGELFRNNPACILSLAYNDVEDPNVIWVEDIWTSEEEHTAALARPEVRPYIARTIPLLEGMPVQTEVVLVGGKGLQMLTRETS